ncbi:uncharacterized protein LOC131849141 [Achroia grisella]|uniref:uncharacterized protein LOC131849141 n=1 Tax=Achroia grisella TaxID=688607 RepID=UPI0027D31230|nr:uncharacterized protein LOC131849141 [Achroia grisella]
MQKIDHDSNLNPCNGVENINIIVFKKKHNRHKRRIKYKIYNRSTNDSMLDSDIIIKYIGVNYYKSIPDLEMFKINKTIIKGYDIAKNKLFHPYCKKYVVNAVSEYRLPEDVNPFNNSVNRVRCKLYRCQLSTQEESCCCSCNSDAMFEVMKSLYDCYKKKNCDHCNCILCGHLPREERRMASMHLTVGMETTDLKEKKKQTIRKTKEAAEAMVGKTTADKEKMFKELAISGAPLPEAKTVSEKQLMKKIRIDLGLPPEPITPAEKEKYKRAVVANLITPLKGKSLAQKEDILRRQIKMGLTLPESRTPSEKALVMKAKATTEPVHLEKTQKAKTADFDTPLEGNLPLPEDRTSSEKAVIVNVKGTKNASSSLAVPSDKIRKAKAAGLLTPLEGKPPERKEKILRSLAMHDFPLPEGKTPSEKKLVLKVRKDLGLPEEPKTTFDKEKYKKAEAAGLITPLEGKSHIQKEKLLRAQTKIGLPLPEGRTPSEKELIAKIKVTAKTPTVFAVPSEKIKKAKAAGLLSPLEGKSREQKENILRGLAMHGTPLPKGKTPSEIKILDKIRKELGLPPEPKTVSDEAKYKKAIKDGIITSLEGKTEAQKENILKRQAETGNSLPEGRTSSEKALMTKIKDTRKVRPAIAVPSEKLRKAKAAGLITTLEGKTVEQKEKILKSLVKANIPLPKIKTPLEKELIKKIRQELSLPAEARIPSMKEKIQKAQAAGLITPSDGKRRAEKEKMLKRILDAGLHLPEGKTSSEKSLIRHIRDDRVVTHSITKVTSAKLPAAKAAGFLTPIEGKNVPQKENILKGLAKSGIPLPEGKTLSQKKLIKKIRKEMGLLPEPKSSSIRGKMQKAEAAGIITPLEGKTPAPILRKLAKAGVPLPEGRSTSEKALIAKIQKEKIDGKPSTQKIFSGKLRQPKVTGLLTSLDATPEQKKKVKGLNEAGLPLPESKTLSEKFGIPFEGKTISEKEIVRKAKGEGLLTPLSGKSLEQKEKILRGLAKAGLPLPVGKTASEKDLINKVLTKLAPEITLSEKGSKIKTRSKKVGVTSVTKQIKTITGTGEEFQDIVKTTKCDRSCGCDKKKIRFKHSYVKIRVTSPDLSSLCPCPDKCISSIKHGVINDNEGIKVTVGRVVGVPSYPLVKNQFRYETSTTKSKYSLKSIFLSLKTNFGNSGDSSNIENSFENIYRSHELRDNSEFTTKAEENFPETDYNNDDLRYVLYSYFYNYIVPYIKKKRNMEVHNHNSGCDMSTSSSCVNYLDSVLHSQTSMYGTNTSTESSCWSFQSAIIVNTESSLSFTTGYLHSESVLKSDVKTISVISFIDSNFSFNGSHYLLSEHSEDESYSYDSMDESEHYINDIEYIGENTGSEYSNFLLKYTKNSINMNKHESFNNDILIFQLSNEKLHKKGIPTVNLCDLNNDQDIVNLAEDVLLQKLCSHASSIVIVISNDDSDSLLSKATSFNCNQIQNWEKPKHYNSKSNELPTKELNITESEYVIARNNPEKDNQEIMQRYHNNRYIRKDKAEYKQQLNEQKYRTVEVNLTKQARLQRIVNVDTTEDRPCCCLPKEPSACKIAHDVGRSS